jgi:hypothetical protein
VGHRSAVGRLIWLHDVSGFGWQTHGLSVT